MNTYPWLKHYPKETSEHVDVDQFDNLLELFQHCVHKYANNPCLTNMGRTITYIELDNLSSRFAGFLQTTTLNPGDRIAIQMPNLLQYPVALLGALKAGMIPVNTNPLYTPSEMRHQFKDSGAKAIVILENYAANLEEIVHQTEISIVIISKVGDLLGPKGLIINLAVKYIRKIVPGYRLDDSIPFIQTIKRRHQRRFIPIQSKKEDIALLQYTGGTTGVSKGAILTHRNLIANILQANAWMQPLLREKEEIVLTPLPLYHVFSFTVNFFSMLTIGANNILITNPRDLKSFLKVMKKYPFTVLTGVNTLFNGLLNQKKFTNIDFSTLKVTVGGAMAIQPMVAKRWKEVTGNTLIEGYGLSETSPLLTCNPISTGNKDGTIGIPVPDTDIIIADDAGKALPHGESGEIYAKGPQVMTGYWQNKDETNMVFQDGWFKTGDIGIMDVDGYIKIVDRKKNMINVSGFKVFPNEVEAVLSAHPKVLESAVIGFKNKDGQEIVTAFIVKKNEDLTRAELDDHCKEYLTTYKRPGRYEFREELPKSNVGKVLHRKLKEQL